MPSPPPQSPALRALVAALGVWSRFDRAVGKSMNAVRTTAGGIFSTALTMPEMDAVTVDLYKGQTAQYGHLAGLHDWERDWYAAELPAAPARILVGAAGAGREVAGLLEQGYTVDAFEPTPTMASTCAQVPAVGVVVTAGFDEFCAAVLDDRTTAATPLAANRYDAVVIGWGGLHHVVADQARDRLLRACCRLAPDGPVLASFHTKGAWLRAEAASRGRRLGARLGRRIARARGIGEPPDGVHFTWRIGFERPLDRDAVERLAQAIGRDVRYSEPLYGCAVFLPPAKPSAPA
jgi:hypothetical protein